MTILIFDKIKGLIWFILTAIYHCLGAGFWPQRIFWCHQFGFICTSLEYPLRFWQTRTHHWGHIVAHVSWAAQTGKHLLQTQIVSEQNQKHFLCPGHKFCFHNKIIVACAGKWGNICVGNNVSSFASTFSPGYQLRKHKTGSYSPPVHAVP